MHVLESVLTFLIQRVLGCLSLRHVNDAVHVEADLLRIRGPGLVTEAIGVPAILFRFKRVVSCADGEIVDLIADAGHLYL